MPNRATPRQPAGTAQEAVGPSPGAHLAPDARGDQPRKNPRGPASPDALLQATDACGYLPQKNTRTPVPVHQGRSRRGRPYPQNRDGSGNAGKAEGSMPRLAPEGQGFEQEITLLRSMINRLLSRRPLNHTYISRYMRLLIQAQSAQARAPRELTDEQEVDSLIKKHFHKEVDDGNTSYYDLLPVRTARPGDKWWPWRQLVSIDERRRDGLIDEEDSTMMDALEEAESSYYGDPLDDDLYDDTDTYDDDPDDEYEQWPGPDDPDLQFPGPDDDDDDYDPDDGSNPGGGAARAETLEACPEPRRRVRAGGGPRPTHTSPYNEDSPLEISVIPAPEPESIPRGGMGGPTPSPSTGEDRGEGDPLPGAESAHPEQGRRVERIPGGAVPAYLPPPSPVGATGRSPDWADHAPPPNPKPRIARGRPPP